MSQSKSFKLGLASKLGIAIALALICGSFMPLAFKQAAFAISLSIKEVLILFLPGIIFAFLFSCLLSFRQGAIFFIIFLLLAVAACNILAIFAAYGASCVVLPHLKLTLAAASIEPLTPLWSFSLPVLIPNQYALIGGLLAGAYFSYRPNATVSEWSHKLKHYALVFLNQYFIPIVPVFVFGFLIKLDHEDMLSQALKVYGPIFLLVIAIDVLVVALFFGIATSFKPAAFFRALKNALPSAITGLSTMSSAASLPMTLQAAEANTKDPVMSEAIVSATVNIHMLGDSISLPVLAMATLMTFGQPLPDLMHFLPFAMYFTLTKFAVAAVPGGSVFVMLPILHQCFGFTGDMASLITAIYIMLDSPGTAANVLGNGAFTMIFTKVYNRFFPQSHTMEESELAETSDIT